jgi:hypothetical protein
MKTIAIAVAFVAVAQDDPAKRVAELVQRLDSSDLREREDAAAEMARVARVQGKPFVDELRKAAAKAPKEPAARIQSLLDALARVDAARVRLAVFDLFEMPSVAGKKLVVYNTGGWWRSGDESGFEYVTGWVASESKEAVEILDDSCVITRYKRGEALNEQARALAGKIPEGRPKPYEFVDADFAKIAEGARDAKEPTGFDAIGHYSRGGLGGTASVALLAYWCLQRGLDDVALRLLERADVLAKERRQEEEKELTTDEVIAIEIASRLHAMTIVDANQGKPREELLKKWKVVASLKSHWAELAKEYVGLYSTMIEEDKAFKDAEPAAAAEKAAYWVHKLRDADARQMGQPGGVSVFQNWDDEGTKKIAAEELRKLGWAALPAVIEHLDDMRPTRCFGFWRDFAPDSYYLLRVADGCQEIFEAITGVDIYRRASTSGSLTNDQKQAAAKKAAQDWWKENGAAGEEAFQVKRLGTEARDFAAVRLLDMDKAKHLPRILDILRDGNAARRAALLAAVAGHLGKEHEELIASFLKEPVLRDVLTAAQVLKQRCGSDAGVAALVEALKTVTATGDDRWALSGAIEFIAAHPSDEVAGTIAGLMQRKETQIRMDAMAYGAACRHPNVAAALVTVLDDTDGTGWTSYYAIRFCDRAAESLVRLLKYGTAYPQDRDPEKRDAWIAAFKTWWAESKDKIDWKKLQEPK